MVRLARVSRGSGTNLPVCMEPLVLSAVQKMSPWAARGQASRLKAISTHSSSLARSSSQARLARHLLSLSLLPFSSLGLVPHKMAGDSFFAKPSSSKRKRAIGGASSSAGSRSTSTSTKAGRPAAPVKRSRGKRDEELSSDDGGEDANVEDMDLTRDTRGGESDEEERDAERRETGGEKRLRIAREYLKGLEAEQQLGTSCFA